MSSTNKASFFSCEKFLTWHQAAAGHDLMGQGYQGCRYTSLGLSSSCIIARQLPQLQPSNLYSGKEIGERGITLTSSGKQNTSQDSFHLTPIRCLLTAHWPEQYNSASSSSNRVLVHCHPKLIKYPVYVEKGIRKI